jgi:hypothetical protein
MATLFALRGHARSAAHARGADRSSLAIEPNCSFNSCRGLSLQQRHLPLDAPGDNPDRLRSETALSMLCGVSAP